MLSKTLFGRVRTTAPATTRALAHHAPAGTSFEPPFIADRLGKVFSVCAFPPSLWMTGGGGGTFLSWYLVPYPRGIHGFFPGAKLLFFRPPVYVYSFFFLFPLRPGPLPLLPGLSLLALRSPS